MGAGDGTGGRGRRVRRARVGDAEAIAAVHVVSWRAGYRGVVDQTVLDDLRSAGCAEALVHVLDDNARGRRFYERAGFVAEATGLPLEAFAFDLTQARYRRAL